MNKRLSVEGPLSVAELERCSRQAREGVGRSQWQISWLVAEGGTGQEVAAQTGYSVPWGRELIHRSHRPGPAGSGDRQPHNPGQRGLGSPEQPADRAPVVDPPRPAGGRWSGPQVAGWMSQRLGRTVCGAPAGRGLPTAAGLHAAAAAATARPGGWCGAGRV